MTSQRDNSMIKGNNQVDMHNQPLQAIDNAASAIVRRRLFMRLAWSITLTVVALVLIAVVDMVLRLDAGIRVAALAAITFGLCLLLIPVVVNRPTRHEACMTIARHLEQHRPVLRGWISAAVDLRRNPAPSGSIQACLTEAQERLDQSGPPRIDRRGSLFAVGALIIVGGSIATTLTLQPSTGAIAMRRVLAPLGKATWPTRTSVVSGMQDVLVHGQGLPLLLLAHNTTPGGQHEPVDAVIQTTSHDGVQTKEIQLLHRDGNQHGLVIDLPVTTTHAEVFFRTADATTDAQELEVRPLPVIATSSLTVTPPWTHEGVLKKTTHQATAVLPSLGSPVLAGSNIQLEVFFDQPMVTPTHSDAWARAHLGWTGPLPTQVNGGPLLWQVEWIASADHRLSLQLEDPDGLRALHRSRLHLQVIKDHPPDVSLLEPVADASLPPSAILSLSATAQDDYPLHWIALRVDTLSGQAVSWQTQVPLEDTHGSTMDTVSLESLGAVPGDVIECRAEAADRGDATTGTRVTQSRARTIHVVTLDRFVDDQHAELAELGARVRAFEQSQSDLLDTSKANQWTRKAQAQQSGLSRDLRQAAKTAESVLEAIDTSRVDSAKDLQHVAEEASLALQEAAAMAVVPLDDQVDRQARQKQVRDQLGTLADRLTGQGDLQLARRTVRDLLDAQRALQSELSVVPDHSQTAREDALEALSNDQEALADRVQSSIEALQRAAERSTSSEAMEVLQKAATELQESSAQGDMRRAADEAQADRQGLARSAQADAARELASIAKSIDQSMEQQKSDVAVLRRRLNDLHALISRLLHRQREAVESLTMQGADGGSSTLLQRLRTGMLGAAQRAAQTTTSDRSVELTLREAADAQSTAIGALHHLPPDQDTAHTNAQQAQERLAHALALLDEARQSLAGQRQQEAVQALATRLLELADEQTALAVETRTELEADKPTRRTRFKARQLSASQSQLGDQIHAVPRDAPVLLQSTVIRSAIQSAADKALGVAIQLLDGTIDESLFAKQSKVSATLQMVAQVLEQSGEQAADPTFTRADAASGGSGQASSQGDGPPTLPSVSELQVLRNMQSTLLQDTRAAIEHGDEAALLHLSAEQASLADVGQALMQSVAGGGVVAKPDGSLKARNIEDQVQNQPTPSDDQSSDNQSNDDQRADTPILTLPTPLPTLDVLLGLEPPSDATVESMPGVGPDALLALGYRMQQAASALANGSNRMASRMQADALDRIDALLSRSRQQAQQQQSGESSQSQQSASSPPNGASQAQGATSSQDQDGSSDAAQGADAAQPLLGGVLEHHGEAWGTLPPRLRQLLEQGRRDGGSTLYAELTAQYFRNLLQMDESP